MCTQGMHWELLFYILPEIRSRAFEELATCAHDMELSIANPRNRAFLVSDIKKKKKKNDDKTPKESLVINTTPLKLFSKGKGKKPNKHLQNEKTHQTLKER